MSKALIDMISGANIYFDYGPSSQHRNLKVKLGNSPESKN